MWLGALPPCPCTTPKDKVITAAPPAVAPDLSHSRNNTVGRGALSVQDGSSFPLLLGFLIPKHKQ